MPSPNTSPVLRNTSPSAIRAEQHRATTTTTTSTEAITTIFSPTSPSQLTADQNVIQWRMNRAPTVQTFIQTESQASDSLEDSIESIDYMEGLMEMEASQVIPANAGIQQTRRSLMTAMRNAANAPEAGRRRSNRPAVSIPNPNQLPQNDELFTSFVMQLAHHPNGATGFEAIANNINSNIPAQQRTGRAAVPGASNQSALRNKTVYQLRCVACAERVCARAMKAILLADTKIELYSTDIPPSPLCLLDDDRMTQGCHCRIRDTACQHCGNVLGYHVSQPCDRCLDAKNNGHFWMFYSETIRATERLDSRSGKIVHWGALTPMKELDEGLWPNASQLYEAFCR